MEILFGRTVSQIKNRFYQNLKDKDVSLIRYKSDTIQPITAPKRNYYNLKEQNKENTISDFKGFNKRNKKSFLKKNCKEQKYNDSYKI